ncbi:MAG: hypothetical protein K8T20_08785 [Planctomycetes bacterium]|nr:hypothetical protein [Planctomycetota bacterium]
MRTRSIFTTAFFALLAVATFVAGAAGPLHEMEALRGHENCEDAGNRLAVHHVCHDQDACTVCGLLALPSVSEPGTPPPPPSERVVECPAPRPDAVLTADPFFVAPARAPPVL